MLDEHCTVRERKAYEHNDEIQVHLYRWCRSARGIGHVLDVVLGDIKRLG